MKINQYLEDLDTQLKQLPIRYIPTVVFVSLKSVSTRLEPLFEKDLKELDDKTAHELKSIWQTIQNLVALEKDELPQACRDIDKTYSYVIDNNIAEVLSEEDTQPESE